MTVRERLRRVSRVFIKSPDDGELISAGSLSELDLGDDSSFRDLEPLNQLPELITTAVPNRRGGRKNAARATNKHRWNAEDLKHYLEGLRKKEDAELPQDKPAIDCVPVMIETSNQREICEQETQTSLDHGRVSESSLTEPRSGEVRTKSLDTIDFSVDDVINKLKNEGEQSSSTLPIAHAAEGEEQESQNISPVIIDGIAVLEVPMKGFEVVPEVTRKAHAEDIHTKLRDLHDLNGGEKTDLSSIQVANSKEANNDSTTPENTNTVAPSPIGLGHSSDSKASLNPEENLPLKDMLIAETNAEDSSERPYTSGNRVDVEAAPNGVDQIRQWALTDQEYDDFLVARFVDWKGAMHIKKNEQSTELSSQIGETVPAVTHSPHSAKQDREHSSARKSFGIRRPVSPTDLAGSIELESRPKSRSPSELLPVPKTPQVKRSLSRKSPISAISPTETNNPLPADLTTIDAKDIIKPEKKQLRTATSVEYSGITGSSNKLTRVGSCKRASKRFARRLIVKFTKIPPPTI